MEPVVFASGRFKRSDGQFQVVQVVGVRSPRLALGPWRYDRQSPFALFDADGVTVDSLDLNILGNPEIDQFYEISDTRVRVSAITRSIRGFSGTLVFTNMVKAKEIVNLAPGRCSAILIRLKPGVDAGSVITALRSMLPRAEVLSTRRPVAGDPHLLHTQYGNRGKLRVFHPDRRTRGNGHYHAHHVHQCPAPPEGVCGSARAGRT